MKLNIRTYVEMRDILYSKQLLDEVKHKYRTINVYFDKQWLKDCKEDYN